MPAAAPSRRARPSFGYRVLVGCGQREIDVLQRRACDFDPVEIDSGLDRPAGEFVERAHGIVDSPLDEPVGVGVGRELDRWWDAGREPETDPRLRTIAFTERRRWSLGDD